MRALFFGIIALAIPSVGMADINVSVTSTVVVRPDSASFSVGVITKAETATEALAQNNEKMKRIFEVIDACGIKSECVQTSQFSLQPVYKTVGSAPHQETVLDGYAVHNLVTVAVHEVETLGTVLDKVVSAGATQARNIHFYTRDEENIRDKARKLACMKARKRAELYADKLGFSLGHIKSVDESYQSFSPQRSYAMEMRARSVPVASGSQGISVTVSVTFGILENLENDKWRFKIENDNIKRK